MAETPKKIEIEELSDLDDAPWCYYAEGHHDESEFMVALGEFLDDDAAYYDGEPVHHKYFFADFVNSETGIRAYHVSGPSDPRAFPVTLVWAY